MIQNSQIYNYQWDNLLIITYNKFIYSFFWRCFLQLREVKMSSFSQFDWDTSGTCPPKNSTKLLTGLLEPTFEEGCFVSGALLDPGGVLFLEEGPKSILGKTWYISTFWDINNILTHFENINIVKKMLEILILIKYCINTDLAYRVSLHHVSS